MVLGGLPAWGVAGGYSNPHDDWWEAELFDALSGHKGELADCRTVPLKVPADASVVIEGWVNPERTAADGPSPGPTMLFLPYAAQQPVFEVTAITMRSNPIYRNHQMTPFTDHQEMPRLFHEAIIYDRLRALGVGIRDVYFSPGGGALSVFIQVEPTMDGQVTDALLSVLGSTWMNTKLVVAVDPDIDISDYRDGHYALATRVDPSRHVEPVGNAAGGVRGPGHRQLRVSRRALRHGDSCLSIQGCGDGWKCAGVAVRSIGRTRLGCLPPHGGEPLSIDSR